MTLMGTRATSALELSECLFAKPIKSDPEFESTAQRFAKQLREAMDGNQNGLKCANFLYTRQEFPISDQFRQIVDKYFEATARELDFRDARQSVDTINADIRSATNDKIDTIVDQISGDIHAILVNAIHFKALWKSKFPKDMTIADQFATSAGQEIPVQMMAQLGSRIGFAMSRHLRASAVELAYEDTNASLIVLLPDEDNSVAELVRNLTVQSLQELIHSIRTRIVDLYLPKVNLQTTLSDELIPALKGLGVRDVFDDKKADFSGLTPKPGLYISDIIHKAVIEWSEEGTEGAAGTGISAATNSIRFTFKANRPFLYFLVNKSADNLIAILVTILVRTPRHTPLLLASTRHSRHYKPNLLPHYSHIIAANTAQ
ncbi:unnamed protein product [Oppiella nova]|uniref:Serpin domain-containing protein n=1 Tax=Oppiella nova TaxID=334625 RepID=A0A7R9QG95_9ACAR|nr:unnamed protein product [Oppiella nova]CAG2164406.1 unnamed protein product [Oppiella nova]